MDTNLPLNLTIRKSSCSTLSVRGVRIPDAERTSGVDEHPTDCTSLPSLLINESHARLSSCCSSCMNAHCLSLQNQVTWRLHFSSDVSIHCAFINDKTREIVCARNLVALIENQQKVQVSKDDQHDPPLPSDSKTSTSLEKHVNNFHDTCLPSLWPHESASVRFARARNYRSPRLAPAQTPPTLPPDVSFLLRQDGLPSTKSR